MVFSSGITYRDMLVGTTCAAVYPQDDVYDVLLEDIHVFRADDAIIDNIYNAGQKHTRIDMTINNIDTVDCTYAPRIIRCRNMGGNPKNFTIRNLSVGAYGLMQTQSGILVENMDGYLDTYNYTFNITNYAIDGSTVSNASRIGLRFDEERNTCNYSTEAGFTPVKRTDHYADYTMPAKVYIGALQLMFNNPVVKQGDELLLPYEEIRTMLRTDKTAATVDVDGVAYVRASALAPAGLCKSAATKNGNLYLTPQYNGENLLLADSGEISHYGRPATLLEGGERNGDLPHRQRGLQAVGGCETLHRRRNRHVRSGNLQTHLQSAGGCRENQCAPRENHAEEQRPLYLQEHFGHQGLDRV